MIDQIHPSLLRKALQLGRNGRRALYERLEFLGDRVVGLVVAEMLYAAFPDEREGSMAKRFVALTREETLARVGEQIGLPERIITRDDTLRHNSSVRFVRWQCRLFPLPARQMQLCRRTHPTASVRVHPAARTVRPRLPLR